MNPFQDKCIVKQANPQGNEIEQVSWYWPQCDDGMWQGPMENWRDAHSKLWYIHVQNFDVAVQAGGGGGMYPRMLAKKFKYVYTFEPFPLSFYCLVNNCQSDGIIKFNAALGDFPHMAHIECSSGNNLGTNRVVEGDQHPKNCQVMTLDSLGLPACGLIAYDLEGYELKALQGSVETIKKYSPVVVLETSCGPVQEFMRGLGYTRDERSAMDTLFHK